MKTKNIIATLGTLALAANLLLPGLSLAQQNANINIVCTTGGSFSITDTPDAVTLGDASGSATIYASGSAQDVFDIAAPADTNLTAANLLKVSDTRSGNNDQCPATLKGFTVTAVASNLTSGPNTITASNFRILTSTAVTAAGLTLDGNVYYSAPAGSGNLHNVSAPLNVAGDDFKTPGNYTAALNTAQTLLTTSTSHNTIVGVGVAIAGTVPANQVPGTYTGTITYTMTTND